MPKSPVQTYHFFIVKKRKYGESFPMCDECFDLFDPPGVKLGWLKLKKLMKTANTPCKHDALNTFDSDKRPFALPNKR
jgi:hypothetical protein